MFHSKTTEKFGALLLPLQMSFDFTQSDIPLTKILIDGGNRPHVNQLTRVHLCCVPFPSIGGSQATDRRIDLLRSWWRFIQKVNV